MHPKLASNSHLSFCLRLLRGMYYHQAQLEALVFVWFCSSFLLSSAESDHLTLPESSEEVT